MVTRVDEVGTEDILAQTVTPDQTESGLRSEADLELFLEKISRASVMLKYGGNSPPFFMHKMHKLLICGIYSFS